jgi:hypothetical protein
VYLQGRLYGAHGRAEPVGGTGGLAQPYGETFFMGDSDSNVKELEIFGIFE